jgi:hypothetical protein
MLRHDTISPTIRHGSILPNGFRRLGVTSRGTLQTRAGQDWLARTIQRTISEPDFTVAVTGLSGTVPFQLKVDRIEIGDRGRGD